MRINVCVGNYAKTPYCIPGPEINVYSMEELCFCIRENAYLIDLAIMDDRLLDWIDSECGLRSLSRELHPLIHKKGSLSSFVVTIFEYVGLYDENIIKGLENVLKDGAGMNSFEKKKTQIDFLSVRKKYHAALTEYDLLIRKWKETESIGEYLPPIDCLASIYHNRGVVLAKMMLFAKAAESFYNAYEISGDRGSFKAYLGAKRLELSEEEYISFVAEQEGAFEISLELEKHMDAIKQEWEESPDFLMLMNRKELHDSADRQRYYSETEKISHLLKSNYRSSVVD